MNESERLNQQSKRFAESYPPGTRIFLEFMDDRYSPVPSGTRGTVELVDAIGQLHMAWDNGRTLALVPGVDSFRKLTPRELEEEQQCSKNRGPDAGSSQRKESLQSKIDAASNRMMQNCSDSGEPAKQTEAER